MSRQTLVATHGIAIVLFHALAYAGYFVGVMHETSLGTFVVWMPPVLLIYLGCNALFKLYQSGEVSGGRWGALRVLLSGGLALALVLQVGLLVQEGPGRPMPLTVLGIAGVLSIGGGFVAIRAAASGWTRQFLQRLLVAGGSTCLAFVGLEVAVRAAFPKPAPLTQAHPIRSHAHRPDSTYLEKMPLGEFEPILVRFNALGLREDREISPNKADQEFRILLLGDSYLEARQVAYAQTLSQQLETRLNREAERLGRQGTVTVINAGVSGYSPAVEYTYLVHEGLALHPDLVVLFFAFNDVTDDFRRYRDTMEMDERGLPVRIGPRTFHWRFKYQWFGWSRTIEVVRDGVRELSARFLGINPQADELAKAYSQYVSAGDASLTTNALAVFEEDDYDAVEQEAWEDTKRYLAGISSVLREQHIPFVLAVVPAPPQVSADQWKVGKLKWGMQRQEVIESTAIQDILRDHAREEGTPFLDLLPAFKAEADVKLFYDYDGHLTVEGHRLAAEETLAFLLRARLLPTPIVEHVSHEGPGGGADDARGG